MTIDRKASRPGGRGLAIALALLAGPAMAGDFNPLGDGSESNNPDLLRDPTTGCENCAPGPAAEDFTPPFQLDWSLGLRGAVVEAGSTTRFESIAVPSVTFTHRTARSAVDLTFDAEAVLNEDHDARIGALNFAARSSYALDAISRVGIESRLTLSQDDPNSSDLASNVLEAPLVLSGSAMASFERDFGQTGITTRAGWARTRNGTTLLDDLTRVDNSYQDTTTYEVGSRLRVGLTPNLAAFVDVGAASELYDQASPSLMVKPDNVTYTAKTGLTGEFGETLAFEGAVGLAFRDFADASLTDVTAALYDASLTFRPNETLELRAGFSSKLGAPGSTAGASAKLEYAATGEAAYRVNPWLRLRGSAGWSRTELVGTGTDEVRLRGGTGADYLLNEHTDLTADYLFTRTLIEPAPAKDEQRVTLGVSFHR